MSCLSPDATTTITSRPKLTLQTTALPRTFGSSTTGLSFSFAAAPAASPTIRNTFKNAYEVTSPSSATSPSKSTRYKPASPYILHPNNNIFNHRSPYQLPIGVRSILRNSPLESTTRRQSGSISAGGNGPNGAASRRVFFPAKKQVSYRYPLEEEIRTERYTAPHLDLVTEEAVQHEADTKIPPETRPTPNPEGEGEKEDTDSSPSTSETSASGDDTSADEGVRGSSLSKTERKKRRTMRVERQVRAVALLDGFEADGSSTPQTPRHGAKRRREWKWTLGPVDQASNNGPESVSLLHSAQVSFGSESPQVSTNFTPGH
ncbi:hypothetical protein N7463_007203 [Penicillium fimorum]|uniref:Uncharacterized protein n=1 Tax=Penicillium fimorum TaxID=1882269 RepID=A0A9W9XW68_9EURO|nr:hypothetical protein N7463_007203 [Penicillium fimorum]